MSAVIGRWHDHPWYCGWERDWSKFTELFPDVKLLSGELDMPILADLVDTATGDTLLAAADDWRQQCFVKGALFAARRLGHGDLPKQPKQWKT